MSHSISQFGHMSLITLTLLIMFSCQNMPESESWLASNKMSEKELREQELKQRESYQTEKDPAAIQWLLAHRIRTGMSVSDVSHIIGEDGQREYESNQILKNDGNYQQTDKVYRWGPDRMGRTYMLVFREDKLVNFDAHQKDFHDPFLDE